jgi:tetratricopeptide (TPR) repeat protein
MKQVDVLLISCTDITSTYHSIAADLIRQWVGYPGSSLERGNPGAGHHVFYLNEAVHALEDKPLNLATDELDLLIIQFYTVDEQIAHWLSTNVGWNTQKARQLDERFSVTTLENLVKRRDELILPDWINQPGYQDLIQYANRLGRRMFALIDLIMERMALLREEAPDRYADSHERQVRTYIQYIMRIMDQGLRALPDIAEEMVHPTTPPDWRLFDSDQRIDDLVDVALERSPRMAIRKLKRALELNPQGHQVIAVYRHLALCYEEVWQGEKAIECYTKAMAATEPQADLLYWRGRVYLAMEQYPAARLDFEQAIVLDDQFRQTELDSADRKEIERLLEEMTKRGY